jgi:hypothetical protein
MTAKGKCSGQNRDFMQVAREVVQHAISEHMDGSPLPSPELGMRNPHAVVFGSLGGKSAKARAVGPHCAKAASYRRKSRLDSTET